MDHSEVSRIELTYNAEQLAVIVKSTWGVGELVSNKVEQLGVFNHLDYMFQGLTL